MHHVEVQIFGPKGFAARAFLSSRELRQILELLGCACGEDQRSRRRARATPGSTRCSVHVRCQRE